MRGTELRELLGRLEESPAAEPSALFVAKLEADLRTMDRTVGTEAPRPRRRRALVALGPIAALTAAAAAAAATLLPSDPHPRQVSTADPGVTAPAPPQTTPSSVPTPTSTPTPTPVVVAPPWLPPVTPSAPPTTAVGHPAVTTPANRPAENPAPTVVAPKEPVTTAVPSPTTTTVPAPETLSLHCSPGVAGGNPIVGCGWGASTSSSFNSYRLWREAQGSSLVIVFQSDNRPTTSYYDQAVQSGTSYYYKLDIINAAGDVIGTSNIVTLSCC